MASLLDRLSLPSSVGPIRTRNSSRGSPYNRPPRGDVNATWSHDLYDGPGESRSLSARLSSSSVPPKAGLSNIAQKALRDATVESTNTNTGLSIKGASMQGNVVQVDGLVKGTTPADVTAIFRRCGAILSAETHRPSVSDETVAIRVKFKSSTSAADAVAKFDGQPADGRTLSVRIIGVAGGASLGGRLGIVQQEGSVDLLMEGTGESTGGSKMRSDSILSDPRAQVLVAPPGVDPAEYTHQQQQRGSFRRGRGSGRRGRRGARMDIDG